MTASWEGRHRAIAAAPLRMPARRDAEVPPRPAPPALPAPPAPRPPCPPRPPLPAAVGRTALGPQARTATGPQAGRASRPAGAAVPRPARVTAAERGKRLLVVTALVLLPFASLLIPPVSGGFAKLLGIAPAAAASEWVSPNGTTVAGGLLPRADGVQVSDDATPPARPPEAVPGAPAPGPSHLLPILLLLLALAPAAASARSTWRMLRAWHAAGAQPGTGFTRRRATRPRIFSLLLPVRHEGRELAGTIDALARQAHDAFEIIVVVGPDDTATAAVARTAARRHPRLVQVVTDPRMAWDRPAALNAAVRFCRGEIVGVLAAGGAVRPGLLQIIEARFEESGAGIVRPGVQPGGVRPSWWSLHDGVERFFWFRSRLQLQVQRRFVPVEGPTVFVHAAALRGFGCSGTGGIGIRLTPGEHRAAVADHPAVVSRTPSPASVSDLLAERTRNLRGNLAWLRSGVWMALPTRRGRLLARARRWLPFLQAAGAVVVPASLAVMLLIGAPAMAALLAFLLLVPAAVGTALKVAGLGEFAGAAGVPIRRRDHLALLLGAIPYRVLLTVAALRALVPVARVAAR